MTEKSPCERKRVPRSGGGRGKVKAPRKRAVPCERAPGVMSPAERQPEGEWLARGLRALREAQGWTLTAVAERAGLTRQTVRRVERGTQTPSMEVMIRLSRALGGELWQRLRSVFVLVARAAVRARVNGRMRPVTERRPAA